MVRPGPPSDQATYAPAGRAAWTHLGTRPDDRTLPGAPAPRRLRPAHHEVLGLRVVADDGGGRLLGMELPRGFLADLHPEAVGADQFGALGVVLEVRAGL